MIPQEKSPAIFRGLRAAFGTTAIEDIRTVPKGLNSDLVFRIVVRGSPGWQAALLNDRYFDLAVAANFMVTNDADEWIYLERYFGEALRIASDRHAWPEGTSRLLPTAG